MEKRISLDVYLKDKPYYLRRESGLELTHDGNHFEYEWHLHEDRAYPYLTIFEHLHPAMHCCSNRGDPVVDDIIRKLDSRRQYNLYKNGTYNAHFSMHIDQSCSELERNDASRKMVYLAVYLATRYSGFVHDPKQNTIFDPKGIKHNTLEVEMNKILSNRNH